MLAGQSLRAHSIVFCVPSDGAVHCWFIFCVPLDGVAHCWSQPVGCLVKVIQSLLFFCEKKSLFVQLLQSAVGQLTCCLLMLNTPGACLEVVALPLYKPRKGVDQDKEGQGQSLVNLRTASHHLMDREAVTRMSGLYQMYLIS